MHIITPTTAADFEQYYHLRYQVLRAPWHQPPGSEKAPDDKTATHALMRNQAGEAVGVCRLHLATATEAHIRFMAVHPDYQGQGLGKKLLNHLEAKARELGAHLITLQAREPAVPFYQSCGYTVLAKTHLLFGEIQHYQMQKILS